MKVGIAQINTKLGDVAANMQKVKDVIDQIGDASEVIVFPEMTLPGYPLHDRIYDKNLLKAQHAALAHIQDYIASTKKELTIVLWFIDFDTTRTWPDGKWIKRNAAAIMDGKTIQTYHKKLLPTYDVFYDKRYFQPGELTTRFPLPGGEVGGITICEDMRTTWYDKNPVAEVMSEENSNDAPMPSMLFNISSSPYTIGKIEKRLDIIQEHVKATDRPFIYVNQVGGQDGHVYDGHSLVVDELGKVLFMGKWFEEEITVVDTKTPCTDLRDEVITESNDKYKNILEAIKLGTKDYLEKTGIKDVVIGVSWGIDSAVSLYILSQILPKERIHAYYLPSKHSQSLGYVKELCGNLWLDFQSISIDSTVQASINETEKVTGEKVTGLAYENIQAQVRGVKLMTLSRMCGGVVINNSNRTEIAQGYATIYGDTIGFMSIIGDLLKNGSIWTRWLYQCTSRHREDSTVNYQKSGFCRTDR
jgi:NAD+ synthase (glutamine-hydrolysing)